MNLQILNLKFYMFLPNSILIQNLRHIYVLKFSNQGLMTAGKMNFILLKSHFDL